MAVSQSEIMSIYWRNSYPQYWSKIIEKHNLKQVYANIFTNMPEYRYRFIGMIGEEIYKNITTGPCLLTSKEINSLNKNTTIEEVRKMLLRHPTFEDFVSIAIKTKKKYITNIILETYEYAKLIEYKTKIGYEDALILTKEAGDNFKKYYDYKLNNLNNNGEVSRINYHYTHTKKMDNKLRELCNEHYQFYLNNSNMSKKGREIIETNPEESTWLRIKVSFLPEAVNKDKTTIIEPASSIEGMKYANMISGSSAVITRSPSSLSNKPVMNDGAPNEVFYLNNDFVEELNKIKSYTNIHKEFYRSSAYGISNIYLKEHLNGEEITDFNSFEIFIKGIFKK
jgi:hypothetical protein